MPGRLLLDIGFHLYKKAERGTIRPTGAESRFASPYKESMVITTTQSGSAIIIMDLQENSYSRLIYFTLEAMQLVDFSNLI